MKKIEDLRPIETTIRPEEAKEIWVRIDSYEKFKDAVVYIHSCARVWPCLYNVVSASDCHIYITCGRDSVDSVVEWVSQWGEVLVVHDVLVYRVVEPRWDIDRYADALIMWEG